MTMIQIAGTSGSGKSTLVRRVMQLYGPRIAVRIPDRKQPYGYMLPRQEGDGPSLGVIGHYETACGGCDTITNMDSIFDAARRTHNSGMDVLFEGLLISAGFNRTFSLHQDGLPIHVIGLDVPLDECLQSINQRRWAKNPEKPPVNPKNTEQKFKGVRSTLKKLQDHGVSVEWHSRDSAYERIKELLHV